MPTSPLWLLGSKKGTLLLPRSYLADDLTGAGQVLGAGGHVGRGKVDLLPGLPVPAARRWHRSRMSPVVRNKGDNSSKSLKFGSFGEFLSAERGIHLTQVTTTGSVVAHGTGGGGLSADTGRARSSI